MGAMDCKTYFAASAGLFAPMGRSYGKPIGGKGAAQAAWNNRLKTDRIPRPGRRLEWPDGLGAGLSALDPRQSRPAHSGGAHPAADASLPARPGRGGLTPRQPPNPTANRHGLPRTTP